MNMEFQETAPVQEGPPPPPPAVLRKRKPWKGMGIGLCVVCAGILVLWYAAMSEYALLERTPWKDAFILFKSPKELPKSETIPVYVRLAERATTLDSDLPLMLMGELVEWDRFDRHIGLSDPEMVIALDLPVERLQPLLESGRLPEPGKPEVLAGDLARPDPFLIDGTKFQVVGTLKRSVSGFLFAYMLPSASAFPAMFTPERGAVEGTLIVQGTRLIEDGLLPEYFATLPPEEGEGEGENEAEEEGEGGEEIAAGTPGDSDGPAPLVVPNYLGGLIRSSNNTTWLALFAMALVAWGGAFFYYSLFRRLKEGDGVILRPFVEEALQRRKLFWSMHLFFYGVFFLAMWSAVEYPLLAYRTKQYIEAVFEVGGLGHVGAAYDSGHITNAAWMTFYNNYIEQTLGLTFLISLFPIPLGLIKNLLSFLLVGGAMSPLWVGSTDMLMLHSLTMALELEAYILACFAITAWPVILISGVLNHRFLPALKRGLLVLFSAMVLTGIILGLAAVYEAMTLIHLI